MKTLYLKATKRRAQASICVQLLCLKGAMRLGFQGLAKHAVSLVLAPAGCIIPPSTVLNEVCSSCPH